MCLLINDNRKGEISTPLVPYLPFHRTGSSVSTIYCLNPKLGSTTPGSRVQKLMMELRRRHFLYIDSQHEVESGSNKCIKNFYCTPV